jgi:hypothetical protein
LSESAIKTFTGLLRGIQPSEPVLLLGYMELQNEAHKPHPEMMRDLFGYSLKNQYELSRPDELERHEFFQQIIGMVRKSPKEFPDPAQRKRRKLVDLPVAPTPLPVPVELTQAQIKAQRRKDRQTLNKLKTSIQPIMDQMRKYRIFVHSAIDDSIIRYLYDETDPKVLSSDLSEEQREQEALFRPYEIDEDEKGVQGLRETATGKFYYNLNTTVIEQRLSNGYYKRPKDFLADVKKLAKDAKTMESQPRTLKANELLANRRSWLSARLCMSVSKQENASANARSKRPSREESRCQSSSRMCHPSTPLIRLLMALDPSCLARRFQESDRFSQSRLAGCRVRVQSRTTGATPTAPPTRPMALQYNPNPTTIRRCTMSARISVNTTIRKAIARRRVYSHSWLTAHS